MARTAEQDEIVLDLIEDLMLLGVDRVGKIRYEVNRQLETQKIGRIGDKRTCASMMERVRGRWQRRTGSAEAERQRLLAEAEEGGRQSYDILRNSTSERNRISALRTVEVFQRRRARLLGLDKIQVDLGMSQEKLDELRKHRLEEAVAGLGADPLLDVYESAPSDPRQGNGPNDPAAAQRPAGANPPG
jgi:hypothetical protein